MRDFGEYSAIFEKWSQLFAKSKTLSVLVCLENKPKNTLALVDMEFLVLCSKSHLTHSLCPLLRYRLENLKSFQHNTSRTTACHRLISIVKNNNYIEVTVTCIVIVNDWQQQITINKSMVIDNINNPQEYIFVSNMFLKMAVLHCSHLTI